MGFGFCRKDLVPAKNASLGFRQDIEGLRAFAVMNVVIFHFKTPFFPGGFAGVDIFFVISGYLITRNIMSEIETSASRSGIFTRAGFGEFSRPCW